MKKLLILTLSLIAFFSCSEPEINNSGQAQHRAAQLAFDLQQLGVNLVSSSAIDEEKIGLLNTMIESYRQDFVSQHDRAAVDFSQPGLDLDSFNSISKDVETSFDELQKTIFSAQKLRPQQIEDLIPANVPVAVRSMVAPLLATTQELYQLGDQPQAGVKKIVKDIERQAENLRRQAAGLPANLKNSGLVMADVFEALTWAVEPLYTGLNGAEMALLPASAAVLTRGSSEGGDGTCSPITSTFYSIIRRIPNALLGAVKGMLAVVVEKKDNGELLRSALIGAAQGFIKEPAEGGSATPTAAKEEKKELSTV